jgi:hypothetical protein
LTIMVNPLSLRALRLLTPLLAVAALAGCVYEPLPPPPPVAYAAPAPGYYPGYAYGPGYYGYPPVVGSVNLGFGYWGGRGRWR